jgi:hypothetical protein
MSSELKYQPFPITQFKGLNQNLPLGSDPHETTSLDGVKVRFGNVLGQFGTAKWDGISSADADSPLRGIFPYYVATTASVQLLRMSPLKMRKWNSATHAWDDITGTALTGNSTTIPQWSIINNTFVFTNDAHDRPRKYTGTGNTAVLGGTPPYAHAIAAFIGFLFLGNVAPDGITFSPYDIQFSDDFDNNWTLCDGNTLSLTETAGEIRALKVFGQQLLAYKSDGIVSIRFIGGAVRFSQLLLPFDKGLLAVQSLQSAGETGHIFLATDKNLYITNGQVVKPLPMNVQKALQEDMPDAQAKFAVGIVNPDETTYHLLYARSSTPTYLDGRLSYNYQTGEFYKRSYTGHQFTSACAFKLDDVTATKLIANAATLTYQLDSGKDDDGTKVTRTYDVDWNTYGVHGNKWLHGAELVFTTKKDCRVRISAASNMRTDFQYARTYSISANGGRVFYDIPSAILGEKFKLRIELFHDAATNVCELKEATPLFTPVSQSRTETPKQSNSLSA